MLSFGFSDNVTKIADLSSEDSTQYMKDLLLQKLILNQYRDEGQNHYCERNNKSNLPSHIRLSSVALTVQSKDSVLTVEMFRTAKLGNC
jgi:hypothetical protein